MKKVIYFLAACLSLTIVGCQNEKDIALNTYDGKGLEFVHFASTTDTWLVTENDESYDYKVVVASTYTHATDVTYNITVGPNTTGEEGVDFSIPTKSVTIPAGQYLAELPVKVLYETTGEGFNLELVLSVDEALINDLYGDTAVVTVKSDKITMDWAWLEGEWSAQDYSYYSGANDGDSYSAAIVKVDETHLLVRNLWGSGADLEATVDFEARTITIPCPQKWFHMDKYEADLYILAVDPANGFDPYEDLETPVVATFSPAGIVFDNYDALLVGGPYNGYTFAGGLRSTLTK